MAGDPGRNISLLGVSLGPVQAYIQKARTVTDLWAGSHLLSYLSWKAMEVVCDRLGPDAVLFPKLWGVPIVDIWLRRQGVPFELLRERNRPPAWMSLASDSNPLFVAALPNRFVAVVPSCRAQDLVQQIEKAVRAEAERVALEAAVLLTGNGKLPEEMDRQIQQQLEKFPEVHWASVAMEELLEWDDSGVLLEGGEGNLQKALEHFFPCEPGSKAGFLGQPQWSFLSQPWSQEHGVFVYKPNPGVLYPALYSLLDMVHAASKTARTFPQLFQSGYRCSLCGELEWLTEDRDLLGLTPGKRTQTVWSAVAKRKPSWARKGEHLCAVCAAKRLWPDIFSRKMKQEIGISLDRFVVSTHTLALASDLYEMVRDPEAQRKVHELTAKAGDLPDAPRVALPLKLHRALPQTEWSDWIRRLPAILDSLREVEASGDLENADKARKQREKLEKQLKAALGHRVETYYSVVIMDGDHMGAWVSGTEPARMVPYERRFHTRVRSGLKQLAKDNPWLSRYLESETVASPAYHGAISVALSRFARNVVPHVIEEIYLGKTIYAGGDDVLALVSVDECLEAALTLRCAFSGLVPGSDKEAIWRLLGWLDEQRRVFTGNLGRGFVKVRDELFPAMGERCSASVGLVVAHHTTPLQLVLREARNAERLAKESGRNRLGIVLLKRSGGATRLVLPFGFGGADDDVLQTSDVGRTPVGALIWLRDMLARDHMSRRAAYQVVAWLDELRGMTGKALSDIDALISKNIAYQLTLHWSGSEDTIEEIAELAAVLGAVSTRIASGRETGEDPASILWSMFSVAEFLAREGRTRTGTTREKI
ncbi:MAG: type III-B CRISPR-associated protein Cas10/Cmr2 [Thermodesulfobacteriota bacterium]